MFRRITIHTVIQIASCALGDSIDLLHIVSVNRGALAVR